MDYCSYVNVFQGNGEIDLPEPSGIAESWHFIKALCGNTHPGAAYPFGKFTCCAYSGGYSSGYGNHAVNCSGMIPRFTSGNRFRGLSHIHNSGTGALGKYFNYCVSTPFYGELQKKDVLNHIINEQAKPGYYSADTEENGIRLECTVSDKIAVHRYAFSQSGGRISFDLSANGLDKSLRNEWHYAKSASINIIENTIEADVVLEGLHIYFYIELSDKNIKGQIWKNNLETGLQKMDFTSGADFFGAVFELESENNVEVKVGISTKSIETAKCQVKSENRSFNEITKSTYDKWNEFLSAIEIQTKNNADKEIFYSNFYHTLIKPCDWQGESCFYSDEEFMIDFVTLWDQYKTQLPLIFSLYPEISKKIVKTFIAFGKSQKLLPHTVCLCDNLNIEAKQARMLAVYVLFDAYLRNPEGYDKQELLEAMYTELHREAFNDFLKEGECEKTTHTLDMAEACRSMSIIAEKIGDKKAYNELLELSENWIKAFDIESGLLFEDRDYYEGNHWNYSFRLMHDMEKRIKLCRSVENFVSLLDKFFGFTDEDSIDTRFEGFNNETDMETPYAYVYANRHDRLCEVIRAADKYMFTSGRGGIPGNNDSGGLSSCYMWNSMGIFPVSGQDKIILGIPKYDKIIINLATGAKLMIVKKGCGNYVKEIYFNGEKLDSYFISVDDFMFGGEIIFITE